MTDPANGTTTGTVTITTPPEPPKAEPKADPDKGAKGFDDKFVPIDRFKEVVGERESLKAQLSERERKDAEEQGRWKELAEKEKSRADSAEERVVITARRAAFVEAGAGKLADLDAAWKLAVADRLLDGIDPDDEGEIDASKVVAIIEKLVEKYPFLAATAKGFGRDHTGREPAPGIDPSKMSATQKMAWAYANPGKRA